MHRTRALPAALVLATSVAAACSAPAPRPTAPAQPAVSPAAAYPSAGRSRVEAPDAAVASANALASEAGVEILRAGGNAVDAAVATSFAVGVVEPQMSGLGGSGSLTIWMEEEGRPYYLDFYAAQNAARMAGATGPLQGDTDLRVVGVPGMTAGLLAAHARFGSLPLERVMAPAIRLAEEGFPLGQILASMVQGAEDKLHRFPAATAQWFPEGRALAPGETYRNPALASTLRRIAREGRDGFYRGPVAEAVVGLLNANGHPATLDDLAGYEPQWKRPLCTDYRGHTVLSAPPPQTGMQILETLELLEPHDLPRLGLPTTSPRAFDVLASALRVGQADQDWNDDPRWTAVPAAMIASEAFASTRRDLVGAARVPAEIEPGDVPTSRPVAAPGCGALEPYGVADGMGADGGAAAAADLGGVASGAAAWGLGAAASDAAAAALSATSKPAAAPTEDAQGTPGRGETTHMSVVDADGNAVALTQTNSTLFGSGAWVEGFFLNDSGYLWRDGVGAMPSGTTWRTRNSTISPTIVLDEDDVRLVIGAPGGGRIPTEIAQVMVYILDYGMDPLEAVRMPRILTSQGSTEVQLEQGFAPELLRSIHSMGWRPVPESFGYARLYLVARSGDRWIAVSDPRHDGEPRGY
ncbi:MAG: gamma-glutamyltransferase family protein [Gemmatimonadetes bacterium]|nr:gamma-glutamyltransferase family protein [Gemmatimonadota bacterium]